MRSCVINMANSKIFHFFACFKAKSVLWDNDYVILKDIAKIQQRYSKNIATFGYWGTSIILLNHNHLNSHIGR